MRTFILKSAALTLLVLSSSLTTQAADPRFGSAYQPQPTRGLLGLPMPQQWTGARGYASNSYGANCPNGQCRPVNCPNGRCSTGQCANGQCPCPNGECSADCCVNGVCMTGECLNGSCPNGQCGTGRCPNGQCATGNCPNGNCGPNASTGFMYDRRSQSDWMPRTTRAPQADPYRGSASRNTEGWTQRSLRPVRTPLEDSFSSRYRQEDLNLRSDYFGNESFDRMDRLSRGRTDERLNSREWVHPSSRRSLEAPTESTGGVARF